MKEWMAEVKQQTRLGEGIYSLEILGDDILNQVKPGQFVDLYTGEKSRLLPRPISICEVKKETGCLRLVYRVAGEGTKEFSQLAPGDFLRVVGPLGNGYKILPVSGILLGGGIGIPPLLELAKELKRKGLASRSVAILGYRDENLFLASEFADTGIQVRIATEDGSRGIKGTILDAIKAETPEGEVIYSCGPKPMLRAVKEYAFAQGLPAQISLEERMGCGIGACLACVCETTEVDEHSQVKNKRICKDGPVFWAEEVKL